MPQNKPAQGLQQLSIFYVFSKLETPGVFSQAPYDLVSQLFSLIFSSGQHAVWELGMVVREQSAKPAALPSFSGLYLGDLSLGQASPILAST